MCAGASITCRKKFLFKISSSGGGRDGVPAIASVAPSLWDINIYPIARTPFSVSCRPGQTRARPCVSVKFIKERYLDEVLIQSV